MINCNTCSFKELCVVQNFMKNHKDFVSLSVDRCTLLKEDEKEIKITLTEPKIDKKKKEYIDSHPKKKIIEINNKIDDKDKKQCTSCLMFFNPNDLLVCSKCGENVCTNCATTNPVSKEILCEQCWESE